MLRSQPVRFGSVHSNGLLIRWLYLDIHIEDQTIATAVHVKVLGVCIGNIIAFPALPNLDSTLELTNDSLGFHDLLLLPGKQCLARESLSVELNHIRYHIRYHIFELFCAHQTLRLLKLTG